MMAPMALRQAPLGTLITVAPTGAEVAKADFPQLPTTLEELVEKAEACEAAGAALIHVHIRDGESRPTLDRGSSRRPSMRSARDRPSRRAVDRWQRPRPVRPRLAVLDAEPDACSLTCGTMNFGDDVFLNP